ncbi:DgyrCDS5125 [Dimorphilus gyrociliatus]|uniref:DgyrCDS5125 n=1 Tax=Dimorphilus gyrociliatus TaxID=2664684 RepID=A0A7I8VL91_9ANNE|nr:DgyrCDS5125 [Dimorphilus gyrociliatus]
MADDSNDNTTASSSNGEVVATDAAATNENTQVQQNGQNAENQQPRPGGWAIFKSLLFRMFIMYMIASFFRRPQQQQEPQKGPDGKPMPSYGPATNMFPKGLALDLYAYLSESEVFDDFKPESLFWLEEELEYGDWTSGLTKDGTYIKDGKIKATPTIQNNGSIYLHVFIVKAGNSPDPRDSSYDKKFTIKKTKRLNKFKKRKFVQTVNLLTGKSDAHPDLIRAQNESKYEILSHWHPNLTINLVDDHTAWTRGAVPAPLDEFIEFHPTVNQYYPVVYLNDYWNMNNEYFPLNDTIKELNFSLTFAPMSLFKWQIYAAQSMRNKWYSFMSDMNDGDDEDQDSLKQTLIETNPYLLALTVVVSLVHSVFEFLAFKNDIQFWKNRKSLEGLSVRSVFFNVFQSLIVCLYVLDNETNFVVKVSVFIGLAIEVWKIGKVVNVKFDRTNKLLGIIPKPYYEDKSTYTESNTKRYDQVRFVY